MYAEIVFPLPFRNSFTYSIPEEFEDLARAGVRAVAPFGKRVLTGFIINILSSTDIQDVKSISDILDDEQVFTPEAIEFYKWLSDYYLSSLGEALKLSVPYGSDIESKKKICVDPAFAAKLLQKEKDKKTTRSRILAVISGREEISFMNLQKIIKKKNIHSILKTLEKQGAVTILDEIIFIIKPVSTLLPKGATALTPARARSSNSSGIE